MHNLPPSLAVALRLTGVIWIFGIVAMLLQADTRVVIAVFVVGLVTAIAEWIVAGKNPPPVDAAADDDANYA